MQNIQQIAERVEIYYECLLKLTNYLWVKAIDVFLTIVLIVTLLLYLKVATISMKKNTLIEHKEDVIVCEESGPVSMSYNALLTTLETNVRVKPVIPTMTAKLALTYTDCGKIGHSMETCHNRKKKKVLVVPTTTIKSIDTVVGTKTQPIKLRKIH